MKAFLYEMEVVGRIQKRQRAPRQYRQECLFIQACNLIQQCYIMKNEKTENRENTDSGKNLFKFNQFLNQKDEWSKQS